MFKFASTYLVLFVDGFSYIYIYIKVYRVLLFLKDDILACVEN